MADLLDPRACGARRFAGKVAVITGAAQGIGRATARRIAQEGGTIVIADRAAEPAREAVAELEAHSISARAIIVDLRSYSEAERLVEETLGAFGQIDVLVNNVGGTIWVRPYWRYDERQIREEVDRSFWPALWCCRAVLPTMQSRGAGSIVNVGSLAPRGIYRVPYAAAKGGVFALTTSLALETARLGIRVNCVAPGPTTITDRMTPRNLTAANPAPEQPEWDAELARMLESETPMQRASSVAEQAAAIAFLASDDASFITAQILCVAGGGTV